MADGLEHQSNVLQARQVRRHDDEYRLHDIHDPEVYFVQPLVHVDDDVVELVDHVVDDFRQMVRGHQFGGFGRRWGEQQFDAGFMLDQDLADQSMSIDAAVARSTTLILSRPRSMKTRWSPNCRLASIRQTRLPISLWSAIAVLIAIVVVPTPPLAP